eukprot:COSAG01_NODE_4256_length_5204_cov_210.952595_2_plen_182_part_00
MRSRAPAYPRVIARQHCPQPARLVGARGKEAGLPEGLYFRAPGRRLGAATAEATPPATEAATAAAAEAAAAAAAAEAATSATLEGGPVTVRRAPLLVIEAATPTAKATATLLTLVARWPALRARRLLHIPNRAPSQVGASRSRLSKATQQQSTGAEEGRGEGRRRRRRLRQQQQQQRRAPS